jgi:hypothetical protein
MDRQRKDLASTLVDHELAEGGIAALADLYDKTFLQLAPIIGARGVRGIFARALEIAKRLHPVFQTLVIEDEPATAASSLAACLVQVSPNEARDAAIELYSAFFGLIVSFVGFELTIRLLHEAWPHLDLKDAQ